MARANGYEVLAKHTDGRLNYSNRTERRASIQSCYNGRPRAFHFTCRRWHSGHLAAQLAWRDACSTRSFACPVRRVCL